MEGPHGQLGTGFADRLGGNHADRLTYLDRLPGSQRHAVTGHRHAGGRIVSERRQDTDTVDVGVVAQQVDLDLADDRPGRKQAPTTLGLGVGDAPALRVSDLHIVGQRAAEQAGLQVEALVLHVSLYALDPDTADSTLGLERIGVVNDQLL